MSTSSSPIPARSTVIVTDRSSSDTSAGGRQLRAAGASDAGDGRSSSEPGTKLRIVTTAE
jgi:hypothetical protein